MKAEPRHVPWIRVRARVIVAPAALALLMFVTGSFTVAGAATSSEPCPDGGTIVATLSTPALSEPMLNLLVVTGPDGFSVDSQILIEAGESSGMAEVHVPSAGAYEVTVSPPPPFAPPEANFVDILPPGCSTSATFGWNFGPAIASVKLVTDPPGDEQGWAVTLMRSGEVLDTLVTDSAGRGDFLPALGSGTYTVKVATNGGFTTEYGADCKFDVNYPSDGDRDFRCTITEHAKVPEGVRIRATSHPLTLKPPGNLNLTYEVTNLGKLNLVNVSVSDNLVGSVGSVDVLRPNAKKTFTRVIAVASDRPSGAEIHVATVRAQDPVGVFWKARSRFMVMIGAAADSPRGGRPEADSVSQSEGGASSVTPTAGTGEPKGPVSVEALGPGRYGSSVTSGAFAASDSLPLRGGPHGLHRTRRQPSSLLRVLSLLSLFLAGALSWTKTKRVWIGRSKYRL